MSKKVIYITEAVREYELKYKDFARERVDVTLKDEKSNETSHKKMYIDDPEIEGIINSYINYLRSKKINIHLDSFFRTWKSRLLYNGITLIGLIGIGNGIFGIANSLNNIVNSAGVQTVAVYLASLIATGSILYMNNKRFYYSKKEIRNMMEIKSELRKCQSLQAKIISGKDHFMSDRYQRDLIDNQELRQRNKERNYQMQLAQMQSSRESRHRVDLGVHQIMEESRRNPRMVTNLNVASTYLGTVSSQGNLRLKIQKGVRRAYKKAKKWIVESFEDDYDQQQRSEESYVVRSEKRGRR